MKATGRRSGRHHRWVFGHRLREVYYSPHYRSFYRIGPANVPTRLI